MAANYPETATEIRDALFFHDISVKNAHIRSHIKRIGKMAFDGCRRLKSLTFEEGVEEIGMDGFAGCGLETVDLPDSINQIGVSAFSRCYNLKQVKLPKRIKEINPYCFFETELNEVDIPDSVTRLGRRAFNGCRFLKSVDFPSNLSVVESECFGKCRSLGSIDFKEGLETVKDNVFKGCKMLQRIYFPDSVKTIGVSLIEDCEGVNIYVPPRKDLDIGIVDMKNWQHSIANYSCSPDDRHTIFYRRGLELPTYRQIYDQNLVFCNKVVNLVSLSGIEVAVMFPYDPSMYRYWESKTEEEYKQVLIKAAAVAMEEDPKKLTVCLETGVILYVDDYFVKE